jgi:hypothetical protein
MELFKKMPAVAFGSLLLLGAGQARAQSSAATDAIEKQLLQLYQTAKATADGTDLVTAGSVLVLQKDHLLMNQVDQPMPTVNVYKNGTIVASGLGAVNFFKAMNKLGAFNPLGNNPAAGTATAAAATTREFVAGEKFWVIRIDTRPDGAVFMLMSDPIKDLRYHATLTLPFARGAIPSPDDVAALASEVMKIDSSTAKDDGAGQSAPQQAAAAAPQTIAIGQTRDQVIATFGAPTKIVQLGAKEIDFFPDMKVTFMQNKVVDVK